MAMSKGKVVVSYRHDDCLLFSSDDEAEMVAPTFGGRHGTYLTDVAATLCVPPAELLDGTDNGKREALPWCRGERRLYRGNGVVLKESLARSRDKAYAKLLRTGFARPQIDDMLDVSEMRSIFVRLTASYYCFTEQLAVLHDDLRSFYVRTPHLYAVRRRPTRDPPHIPCWIRPY